MSDIPFFVLVRPQMGENIGSAARAMWNFGLDRMRIVAPRDGWPNQSAVALASGAGRLLDEAQLSPDLPDAVQDCTYVYATTARARDLTKPVLSPEAAMRDAAARIADGQKVAVMFGPERAGLENEASLNLAQCVLLVGYEWMRASGEVVHRSDEMAGTDWAQGVEVEHLAVHYEDALDTAGFFFPEQKSASMRTNLRNMWSRMPLTRADVQMFHGVMRQMVRWAQKRD